MLFRFPDNFYFGAATSAHQVEGGNHNDWSEWELKSAKIKTQNAKLKNWPDYILNPPAGGPNPLWEENYISGRACDHYNRYEEDFDLAKQLGHNAHRFSIEWSRIEPEEGKFSEKEIMHYRKVIGALKSRGIEPFVTLWHWTNPVWFAKGGGWLRLDAEKKFLNFVKKVVTEYRDEIKHWITFNEPETFPRMAYLTGARPPGCRFRIISTLKIMKKLAKTHRAAYELIHSIAPSAAVGFSESLVYFESYNRWPHNLLLMKFLKWWRNNPFYNEFVSRSDFIGLQYYFHTRIRLNPEKSQWGFQYNENKEMSDFGWEIYPEGIYHILEDLKKYDKPIYITENGLADARDQKRARFIKDHLCWVAKAIKQGVDVRGYFHWSLLDNFEWEQGFWPRFGLIEIDYRTLERKIRPSALDYKRIIETKQLEL